MGFFTKKKKKREQDESTEEGTKQQSKKISDKDIKPKAPRGLAGKQAIRAFFWIFISLLLLKGTLSFAQGTRVINQITNIGTTTTVVSDSVKGFAVDFATEYFSWDTDFVGRSTKLGKFIRGIDSNMGLKSTDVNGSSRVSSVVVYGTNKIDDHHVDVTVVVWREVQMLPDRITVAQGIATEPEIMQKKTYMIVPVTLASEGPVIESYPRFVSEQQKGETIDHAYKGTVITDSDLNGRGTDLADSFLRSWYEGNASQLKYFYADHVNTPKNIPKSEFSYKELENVRIYLSPIDIEGLKTYRIEAVAVVKSVLDEPFTNSWTLQVTEKEGKLYVLSNGTQQIEISEPNPAATESNASQESESITQPNVTPVDPIEQAVSEGVITEDVIIEGDQTALHNNTDEPLITP